MLPALPRCLAERVRIGADPQSLRPCDEQPRQGAQEAAGRDPPRSPPPLVSTAASTRPPSSYFLFKRASSDGRQSTATAPTPCTHAPSHAACGPERAQHAAPARVTRHGGEGLARRPAAGAVTWRSPTWGGSRLHAGPRTMYAACTCLDLAGRKVWAPWVRSAAQRASTRALIGRLRP